LDPLIKSQLLYHLSYAPENAAPLERGRTRPGLCQKPGVLPLALPRLACPVCLSLEMACQAAHHNALVSSGRKTTLRLTWALSTKPSPTIMVSIEVPP
jgi:hypothetical protein